jgi:hypothetical protein
VNLDRLQELCEAATSGPWHADACGWGGGVIWAGQPEERPGKPVYVQHPEQADPLSAEDVDYISAASPDVVLRLLAVARAAQQLVAEYPSMRQGRQLSGPLNTALAALESGRDADTEATR